jgi:hypothetical protein
MRECLNTFKRVGAIWRLKIERKQVEEPKQNVSGEEEPNTLKRTSI